MAGHFPPVANWPELRQKLEQLKKEGMQVTEVDRAAFAAAVEPAYPEYYKKFDKKLIESIRDTK